MHLLLLEATRAGCLLACSTLAAHLHRLVPCNCKTCSPPPPDRSISSYSSLLSQPPRYKWQHHRPLSQHCHTEPYCSALVACAESATTARKPSRRGQQDSIMHAMQRVVLLCLLVFSSAIITASAQAPTAAPTTPTPTPAAPAPAAGTTNITGVLAKAGQFNTFIRLLRSTGVAQQIDNQLNSSGNGLTIFAPTDNAFTSLPSGTLNSLSDQQKNALVQFHVLSTLIPMSQFDTVSNPLRTQAGNNSPGQYPLNITSEGQQVNISTGVVNATVDNSLYSGDNLVVYQVNKVLLPAALFGSTAPAPAPLAPAKKRKTPASVADAPDGADVSPDATASLAAARVTGGGAAAVLALAGVWWGL